MTFRWTKLELRFRLCVDCFFRRVVLVDPLLSVCLLNLWGKSIEAVNDIFVSLGSPFALWQSAGAELCVESFFHLGYVFFVFKNLPPSPQLGWLG